MLGNIVRLGQLFPDTADETETCWNGRVVVIKKLKENAPIAADRIWEVHSFEGDSLLVFEREMFPVFSRNIAILDTQESR